MDRNVLQSGLTYLLFSAWFLYVILAIPNHVLGDAIGVSDGFTYKETSEDTTISLKGTQISEGVADSAVVGTITLTKKSRDQIRELFLKEDAGKRFGLTKDSLLIVRNSDLLDYERHSEHRIVIAFTTARRDTIEQSYEINVLNVNDPPRIKELSANRIPENDRDSLEVGVLSVTDQDSADLVKLKLIKDAGGRFRLQDRTLIATDTARFNYERQKEHFVTVRAIDQDSAIHTRTFRIQVLDRNDPPQAIAVQPPAVPEDLEPGSLVGKVQVRDEDSDDRHAIRIGRLTSDVFVLRDTLLYLSDTYRLDHETQPRVRFSLVAEDSSGASIEDTVQIRVRDVNEPPSVFSNGRRVMKEDHIRNYTLQVRDPETPSGVLDLKIKSLNPDLITANRIRHINRGEQRLLKISPRPDSNGVAEIMVTVSDGEFIDSTRFEVRVRPVNDSPYLIRNIKRRLDEGAKLLLKDRFLKVGDVDDPLDELTYEILDPPKHGGILKNKRILGTRAFTQRDVMDEKIWYRHDGSEHHRDTVKFVVRDEEGAKLSAFILPFQMVPINDPPEVSGIEDRFILEDNATEPRPFVIQDTETAGINLAVSGASSNQVLVPDSNIVIRGVDRYRTVRVRPLADAHGKTSIAISVNDGKDTVSTSFNVTVEPVNDAPVVKIKDILQSKEDVTAGPYKVHIFDQETDTDQLKYSIESTNERLIDAEGIHLKGGGPDKQLYLSPNKNKFGKTELVIQVSDGALSDTARSLIRVKPVNDPPRSFSLFNSNLKQTFDSVRVAFKWEETVDMEQDNINYIFQLTGSNLDTVIHDIRKSHFTFRTKGALKPNKEYQWKVFATDGKDTTESKSSKQFLTPNLKQAPQKFRLYSNYPNPFNPVTRIKYKIPVTSNVRVAVYDMSGRMVTELVDKVQSPGEYEVSWHAGEQASGIYVCRIMANSLQGDHRFVETKKMMLVK